MTDWDKAVKYYAHHIWLNEGKPDGEQEIPTLLGPMKLKYLHWIKAEVIVDTDFEIFRYSSPEMYQEYMAGVNSFLKDLEK